MLNREVFSNDPVLAHLPNDGVAKIAEPKDAKAWEAAEFELKTFVCEGAYHEGLNRILLTYLGAMEKSTQPAVWVSGFYGSGKSHLVRVLEFLWRDLPFPSGATARGLVTLPSDVREKLRELTTIGKQEGGLWSAAGTPVSGAGVSVRLAVLGVLLTSAGLPEQISQARFVLWLKAKGWFDAVVASVAGEDEDFSRELQELTLSTAIARALLKVDAALAENEATLLDRLKREFPTVTDVSDEEMLSIMESILKLQSKRDGRLPCALVVLDELQQYAANDAERIVQLQSVVEKACTRFGGRLLFVGTGQSALEGNMALSRLQDRFTVKVQLTDTDVESVVRRVVLAKLPSKRSDVEQVLDRFSGEIDRQLAGTRLGPRSADSDVLVPDYPLLPVRRRFWEQVLRSIDTGGSAQLRTQLRITLEAVKAVGNEPLGTVVGADFLFNQQLASMQRSGILLQETHAAIMRLANEGPDGRLCSRICAVAFLINRLNRQGGTDIGIRANADTFADLLVEDLAAGSEEMRRRIPGLLEKLVETGVLMLVGSEYRLQTTVGREWTNERRLRAQRILNDPGRIAGRRQEEIKKAVTTAIGNLRFSQGAANVPRSMELQFGEDAPKSDSGVVPVWIRDEWSVSLAAVQNDARSAGLDSPTVFVFLPKVLGDGLDRALAEREAAVETIDSKGAEPSTSEAMEAKRSLESHIQAAKEEIEELLRSLIAGARVYQGGGAPLENGLKESVSAAVRNSVIRLFPRFGDADVPGWEKVIKLAKQGNAGALTGIGYQSDIATHPVVQEILAFVGAAGAKASLVRAKFDAPPFGWPRDAVDGALLAALAGDYLRALKNGVAISASSIEQSSLGQIEFRRENITITTEQRIAVAGVLQHCGIPCKPHEEAACLAELVRRLASLAEACGGAQPLPAVPDAEHLQAMRSLQGNEIVLAAFEKRTQLKQEFDQWTRLSAAARIRTAQWQRLDHLLHMSRALDSHTAAAAERDAIKTSRSLLSEPDPVVPLIRAVADALRQAVQEARTRYLGVYADLIDGLERDERWKSLTEQQRGAIRAENGLGPEPPLRVGTDDELIAELSARPLAEWESRTAALSERIIRALHAAVKLLEPQAVRVRFEPMTFKTADEVRGYLAAVEKRILAEIEAGNCVVVGA